MFSNTRFTAAFLVATLFLTYDQSEAQSAHDAMEHTSAPASESVPLYDDLGDHHVQITTDSAAAQKYFDQGMRLYYAFNHAEAVRAFKEAQRLDVNCAMCWWGEAMAWGPNINLPMDEPSGLAAYAAMQGALARRKYASKHEQELIDGLAVRYAPKPPADRASLDQAYSDAMALIAARYPENQEVAVLYAESLMDLRPWDYWAEDGSPNPGIADALASLDSVIAVNEKHPGACHFFIHAVEKLYPERAIECAERLANLMPGAGHLVHMPGHIYIRVGRYLDAVNANKHAIHADETYIQDQNPAMGMYTAGYYPHNYDFMAFATMMIGQSNVSIQAAEKVSHLIPTELFGAPGMDFLQHYSMRPIADSSSLCSLGGTADNCRATGISASCYGNLALRPRSCARSPARHRSCGARARQIACHCRIAVTEGYEIGIQFVRRCTGRCGKRAGRVGGCGRR